MKNSKDQKPFVFKVTVDEQTMALHEQIVAYKTQWFLSEVRFEFEKRIKAILMDLGLPDTQERREALMYFLMGAATYAYPIAERNASVWFGLRHDSE